MDKTKLKSRCYLVILLAVFIAAWQVLADRGMINPLFFSSPKQVLADMAEMFSTGYIMPHIGITLYAAFLGLFYGIVLGTAIAQGSSPYSGTDLRRNPRPAASGIRAIVRGMVRDRNQIKDIHGNDQRVFPGVF